MEQFEYNGTKFTIHDDGTQTIVTPEGRTMTTKPDGNMSVSLDQITSIGIHNIVDIATYNLIEREGLTLHHIVFRDGGVVSFAYDTKGKIENLAANHVNVSISREGEVVYSMFSADRKAE